MPKEDHYLKTQLVNNQISIAFLLSVHYIMLYQIHINCLSFQCLIGNVYLLFLNCTKEIDFIERNKVRKQKMLYYLTNKNINCNKPSKEKFTSGLQIKKICHLNCNTDLN